MEMNSSNPEGLGIFSVICEKQMLCQAREKNQLLGGSGYILCSVKHIRVIYTVEPKLIIFFFLFFYSFMCFFYFYNNEINLQ